MGDLDENLTFSIHETCNKENDGAEVTYEDLVKEVNVMEMVAEVSMDDFVALEVDYETNYIKKELDHIANYYEISRRKKRKRQLVRDIVIFEKNPANIELVYRRKKLWSYIEEIRSDKYLSKFLILD